VNPFEFVIAIVAITTIGQIIKVKQMAKYGVRRREGRRGAFGLPPLSDALGFRGRNDEREEYGDDIETLRLREEVKMLKERLHTLERITVDKESSLARQIDDLRDG